jgi:DNA polymerase-3 subunit delta
MKDIKNDIKTKTFKPVYLLYGEERFLVEHYAAALCGALLDAESAVMNRDAFDGKEVPCRQITDAANTLPFLHDTRVVCVRESGLFAQGRKNDSEAMAAYLPDIPETTVMLFVETQVDKRGKLYKQAAALGRAAECTHPPPGELLKWVQNVFNKMGKTINRETAEYLLATVSRHMTAIRAEAEKLNAHAGERTEITRGDIDAVCCPGLEARVFALVAAVGEGNGGKALRLYRNMLLLKESPLMVLTMLARQFRLILLCKAARERKLPDIAQALGLRGFAVEDCLRQGQGFTAGRLVQALRDCLDMDIRIKTGLMDAELGPEVLIARYSARGTPR